LLNRGDKHHVFPRKYLQREGVSRNSYNQIANFVMAQSEINIAISDKAPEIYFAELTAQVGGGLKKYGGITNREELEINLSMNCIPEIMLDGGNINYSVFLAERRLLMADKIRKWNELL